MSLQYVMLQVEGDKHSTDRETIRTQHFCEEAQRFEMMMFSIIITEQTDR